jgi:hypothetical protein
LTGLSADAWYFYQVRTNEENTSEFLVSSIDSFRTEKTIVTTGLFFSEYVEGSSFNKAVEIYNGTGQIVDLSKVVISKDVNGNDSFSSVATLSGLLPIDSVYVVAHSSSDSALAAVADTLFSGPINFNGDDQLQLTYNGVLVDHIGVSADIDFGKDVTLRRKASITSGNLTNTETEWDSFGQNDFDGLGERSTLISISFTSAPTISDIGLDSANISFQSSDSAIAMIRYGLSNNYTDSISLNSSDINFSETLDGLSEGTEYHYNVSLIRTNDLNTITSSDGTFTTQSMALIFTETPLAANITDSTAELKWATNFNSNSVVFFGLDSLAFDSVLTVTSVIKDSVELINLLEGRTYYYQVRSSKESSTEMILSKLDSFQTTKTFLSINSGPSVFNITDSTVMISWESNLLAIGTIFFGTDSSMLDSISGINTALTDTVIIAGH